MRPEKQPRWAAGDEFTREQANDRSRAIERINNLAVDSASGLELQRAGSGLILRDQSGDDPFLAQLSGASSPYSWTKYVETAAGTLTATSITGTSNAYEMNGRTGLSGKYARLYPDAFGGFRFTAKNCCTPSCTGTLTVNVKCGGVNVVSATVTITQGATSYSGSTNASGNVTFTPGISGTWDITVSKSGLTTYTSTFSWSCTTATVNVAMSSPSNVLSGNVKGCNTTGLSGVSITLKQGATTLGTATSDASGNYSITFAWSSGSLTYEATKSRFSNFTSGTFTPSGCNLTTTSNFTMSPATGYRCIVCGGANPISETLFNSTPSGNTVTMAYTASTAPGGPGWEATETISGRIWTGCGLFDPKTTSNFDILWDLYGPVGGSCALTGGILGCIANFHSPIPTGTAGTNYISGQGTVSGVSITASPFTITYTHSYNDADGTLVSGSGTITE